MNTVNKTHLKTIYKGCAPNGTHADPSRSYVVRFTWHDAYSHATLMSILSPAFLHAQQNADEKISSDPFHISVLWPFEPNHKRKPQNKETALESLLWFIENMMDPANGAIVSIYKTDGIAHQGEQWRHSQIWPLKQQWSPKGNYVTVQKTESNMSKNRIDRVQKHESVCLPMIQMHAEQFGYDIKYVDYTLTCQEIVDTIQGSDWHFTYSGATMYTAAMMGVPCLAWHSQREVTSEERLVRDYDNPNKINSYQVQNTPWGTMSSHPGKIKQYNVKKKRVETYPIQKNWHIEDPSDIELIFKRMLK